MKRITVLFIILMIASLLPAENDFLLINNSPESAGKGNTGAAEYSDCSYALINPAATVLNRSAQISFCYKILNNDLNYNYLNTGYPLYRGMLSLHVIFISLPDNFEITGGEKSSTVLTYSDLAVALSDSIRINDSLNAGVTCKYIKREITGIQDSAYAVDLGLIQDLNFFNLSKKYYNNLSLGLALKNMGQNMKFISTEEELPLTFCTGIKYSPYYSSSFLYDINKTIEKNTSHYLGFEYRTPVYFTPRIGISFEEETVLMTGIGVNYGSESLKFKFDYAFNLLGKMVKVHSLSINLQTSAF